MNGILYHYCSVDAFFYIIKKCKFKAIGHYKIKGLSGMHSM